MTPTGTTVLELVDEAVAAAPDRIAVRGAGATLTYGELSIRADRVAQRLLRLGVGPGDLVGQVVERSAGLVVAALGILRAGGAYVAIDPRYPEERLRWMLDDCAPAAVVTDETTAARLSEGGERPTLVLSDGGELEAAPPSESPESSPLPPGASDLAYVVYTSGSTGRPKGVMIEHAGLLNLVEWHRAAFGLGAGDRCTQIASPGFDAAVWEIWPALAAGAAIHVVPEALRVDPIGLRDWLVAEGITVTFLPTAVAEGVIGLSWPADGSLRFLLTGGDALARRPAADLDFTVVNNYGLSETAVVATSGVVAADGEGQPSIGRPIDGVVTQIVDERLAAVEQGATGELVIGGVAVARGYLNRPDLTAERFLDDGERGRLYRTGDRARIGAAGEIEFLGRLDDQMSIRGFRVEPGEVAAALNSHPAVETSVTVALGGSSADRQLVAYVVAAGGERPDHDRLAEFLGGLLPDYMVPSRYVWLDRLPLNRHGKVDREALPEPAQTKAVTPKGKSSGTQATIAAVVAELLDVPAVEVDQNFFLLGGHSMLGAQLIVRLEELFGAEVSLRYLFDHPTPAELAVEVERQVAAGARPHPAGELATGPVPG
ncbi:MAG TPA: non-ribosomal peptide synthetase [Solirubrobacterales bacterium]|jgi:amino acid adenylation domain-containing protein|nr:non-ribosomal peptide synthetase [Solirubrobacterales bacterium]